MLKRKVLVIADDFSGAAEMAALLLSHGLPSELQYELDFSTPCPALVYLLDIRERPKNEVRKHVRYFFDKFKESGEQPLVFFKIDSVLRGHLQEVVVPALKFFSAKRAWIMPANPSKGRVIEAARYLIHGEPIDKTPFAKDPGHPRKSANVASLTNVAFEYLTFSEEIPGRGVLLPEVRALADIKRYLAHCTEHDLIFGAADTFSAFLEHGGYQKKDHELHHEESLQLIINGSTFLNNNLYTKETIANMTLAGRGLENLDQERINVFISEVHQALRAKGKVGLVPGKLVETGLELGSVIHTIFSEVIVSTQRKFQQRAVTVLISGGHTANALLQSLNIKKFRVSRLYTKELVWLDLQNSNFKFIVKPGSYLWPWETNIENEANNRN